MRRPASVVALVLAAALASGCGVSAQGDATVAGDDAVPFGLLDPTEEPLVPPATGPIADPVGLCFVREGRLAVVLTSLSAPISLLDAVKALVVPPAGIDPPVRSAVTGEAVVHDAKLTSGVAQVDLGQRVAELSGEEQLLAVAQIVCTLTGRPGVGQVSFTLDGVPLAVPKGDGSLVTSPVSRDDYASLLS